LPHVVACDEPAAGGRPGDAVDWAACFVNGGGNVFGAKAVGGVVLFDDCRHHIFDGIWRAVEGSVVTPVSVVYSSLDPAEGCAIVVYCFPDYRLSHTFAVVDVPCFVECHVEGSIEA